MNRCLLIIILLAIEGYCFNFITETDLIFGSNGNSLRSDYFGFSVGIVRYENGTAWLVIGAPRGNSSYNRNINEPGVVYKCLIDSANPACQQIYLDSDENMASYGSRHSIYRDHSWNGASIDISHNSNTVVCAPRWTIIKTRSYLMYGKCYILSPELQDLRNTVIKDLADRNHDSSNSGYYFGMGQLGMSAHFVYNTEWLLLGGPGIANWCGSVLTMEKIHLYSPGGINRRKRAVEYAASSTPNPYSAFNCKNFRLLGYSLTSGRFSLNNETSFVAGAPIGNDIKGMVLIYPSSLSRNFPIMKKIKGTQMGEYFGASVAAVDIDSNGLDDLVVGAPHHSKDNIRELGCVYVFMSRQRTGIPENVGVKLHGDLKIGSRFGTALASADLNADGYPDILVGAPYEDNHGAVYVFNGHRYGIGKSYSQKLYPNSKGHQKSLRGFGISFSRPSDIDGNHYPDIAIGSFLSQNVVVMLTRPVVSLIGNLTCKPKKLDALTKNFELKVCNMYYLPRHKHDPRHIAINYTVQITGRKMQTNAVSFAENGYTKLNGIMNLTAGVQRCITHTLNIAEMHTEINEPIEIQMMNGILKTARLIESPVIDPRRSGTESISVSFITGCESDGSPTCITNLSLMVLSFENAAGRISIGSVKTLTLILQVINTGEPAFLPNATITVALPLNFVAFPRTCQKTRNATNMTLVCQLKNPLNTEDGLTVGIDVSLLSENSRDSNIVASIASSSDWDASPQNDMGILPLQLKRDSSVGIVGFINFEKVLFNRWENSSIPVKSIISVNHVTTITKTGPTPVGEIKISLWIPESISVGEDVLPLLEINKTEVNFYGLSRPCISYEIASSSSHRSLPRLLLNINCTKSLFNCIELICNVGPWNFDGDTASLEIALQLNFTTLRQIIPMYNDSFILTRIDASIVRTNKQSYDEGNWNANGTVKIHLVPTDLKEKQTIKWWIALLAVIVGVFNILLIIFILHKMGFFERKHQAQMTTYRANLVKMENTKK